MITSPNGALTDEEVVRLECKQDADEERVPADLAGLHFTLPSCFLGPTMGSRHIFAGRTYLRTLTALCSSHDNALSLMVPVRLGVGDPQE